MELRYRFDPEKFYLGKICNYGHKWPGTELSLRRKPGLAYKRNLVKPMKNDCAGGNCIACCGRKKSNWLISFIDSEATGLPQGWKLGKLCKAEHRWNGLDMTLRGKDSRCPECVRIRLKQEEVRQQRRQNARNWRNANAELASIYAKTCYVRMRSDPEKWAAYLANRRVLKAAKRAKSREAGLTSRGEPVRNHAMQIVLCGSPEERMVKHAIRDAGGCPTVVELIWKEQRRYWAENQDSYRAFCTERNKQRARWRQMTDPEYRLYHRQKSKRRKALLRGSIGLHVKPKQLRSRFAEFDNCCAYCGMSGEDLHIEHVIPISKGGTHVIGNIVPACQRCNFSKTNNEVEPWYRAQSFFTEARWKKIRRVLGWDRSSTGQLSLL